MRNTDFKLDDLADWSSIPSNLAASHRVITDNHQEEEEEEVEMSKRDGGFDISDLVDLSTLVIPGAAETAANGAASEDDLPGDHLNPSDFFAADYVKDSNPSYEEEDPILKAKLFEGDIDNVDMGLLEKSLDGQSPRNAIRDSWRKWPEGVIPYVISSSFNSRERSIIAKAMNEYHEKTCIRFEPRNSERGYINIMKGSGCSSSVGRTGSRQQVSLGNGCVYTGIVIHELMHATGFWHEQSRADRDSHITINWRNIKAGMEFNFLKYDLNKIDHLGAKYDTCSVMHYGSTAFAKVNRMVFSEIIPLWCVCSVLGTEDNRSKAPYKVSDRTERGFL